MRHLTCLFLSILLMMSPALTFAQASSSDDYETTRKPKTIEQPSPANDPLLFTFPDAGSERDCFFQGVLDGRRIARIIWSSDGTDWAGHAALSQFVYGNDGGTFAYAMASTSRDLPPEPVLSKLNPLTMQYQQGFLQGYDQQMHQMNREDAGFGLVVGMLAAAAVGVAVLIGARHK